MTDLRYAGTRSRFTLLHRYVLGQFLAVFILCLLGATVLFVVFDLFEQMRIFLKEDSAFSHAALYILFRIPFVVQLMTPIAVLVATMISVGRLSQLSEVTAMRACGVSLLWLARPLMLCGILFSFLVFIAGETIVPWATERAQEIYTVDIRKQVEKGVFSRTNFWYRSQERFYNIGYYDSRAATIQGLAIFEFDRSFRLRRRIDAKQALWEGPQIGWTMREVVEASFNQGGDVDFSHFEKLPLVIPEEPADLYNFKRHSETMSYTDLRKYIDKLRKDGVSVVSYEVDLAAKFSFPFVNFVVVLIAFPFSLIPARSGTLTASFIAGVTIGFGYHVLHALCTSLGSAELVPIQAAAWAANIILGSIGGYLMAGAEDS